MIVTFALMEKERIDIFMNKGTIDQLEDRCSGCVYYPPSSTDGKPCCMCDSDDVYFNCYIDRSDALNN